MPIFGLKAFQLLIRFSVALALTLSLMQSALAAKQPSDDSYLWRYHYYGVLGKNNKISMIIGSLHDGQLVGSYRYVKIGAPIILSGKITPDGAFDLVEKTVPDKGNTKREQITGKLNGRFGKSFQDIQGTWSSLDGKKTFPFKLSRGVLVDYETIDNLPDNHGILVNAQDVALDAVKSFCEWIGNTLDDRRTRTNCDMADSTTIGTSGGKEYRLVEFDESGTWWDASSFKDSYSVLFEFSNDKAKPFWLYKIRDDGSSLYEIKLLQEGPYPVFQATYNSGGTRPAWHDFVIRRPSGFSMIDTEKLERSVFKIAKDNGYETRSTLYFDFVKHQASNAFYRSKDGNCCASAEISLIFDIVSDVMVLKDYKIELDGRQ